MSKSDQILVALLCAIGITVGVHYGAPYAYQYVGGHIGIPVGKLHVLFVYDPTKLASLPSDQQRVLLDGGVRTYLKEHGEGQFLPVGSTDVAKEWTGMYDDAIKDGRLPCIVVSTESGKRLDLEAWPKSPADTITLLQKYGGQ